MIYPLSLDKLAVPAKDYTKASHKTFSRHVIMVWLVGMFFLSPIKIFTLPLNLEMVDIWVVTTLPLLWAAFILRPQTRISLPITVVTILILLGSFVSTFVAPNVERSMVVMGKEVYLYLLFVTITAFFYRLDDDDLRRILIVWAGVVIAHGVLIITQLMFPPVWRMTAGLVGKPAGFANFRPSGLFMSKEAGDANKAAAFQLLGFVPLLLARLPRRTTVILGIVLLCSILSTGSMGTTIGFTTGLMTAVVAIAIVHRRVAAMIKNVMKVVVAVAFFLGLVAFFFSQFPEYQTRVESILFGRSERSAGGRFDLWSRGVDVFHDHGAYLWGVGPGNFRDVDGMDKQLHNDMLAFTVERGLLTALFLVLFAGIAVSRALVLLKFHRRYPDTVGSEVVVFLATIVAMLALSLTHQIFHTRELWIVLGCQEAMLFSIVSKLQIKSQSEKIRV